jgi:glycosyltransferase involved in cell wall biosynthesis
VHEAPTVSVLMTTFDHEAYIAQAVTSALTQQTNFPIEIIVGEDCSTDRTRQILVDLQRDHPQTLRLLLHERNIGGPLNTAAVFSACRGQYVAMLEGDDYWTHPLKLQKQVDALEAHPEWAICFHPTRVVRDDGSKPPRLYPVNWTKDVATIEDLFHSNFMATCSVVFRNRLFGQVPDWHSEITPGDWALHILNADRGQIGFLNEVLGDYRLHSRGMWASKSRAARDVEILRMFSRIDHHFHGKYARQIDEYRIRLVTSLLDSLEDANRRRASHPRSHLDRPQTRGRSAVYRLGRVVMRPLERIGRRCGAALGLPTRAA